MSTPQITNGDLWEGALAIEMSDMTDEKIKRNKRWETIETRWREAPSTIRWKLRALAKQSIGRILSVDTRRHKNSGVECLSQKCKSGDPADIRQGEIRLSAKHHSEELNGSRWKRESSWCQDLTDFAESSNHVEERAWITDWMKQRKGTHWTGELRTECYQHVTGSIINEIQRQEQQNGERFVRKLLVALLGNVDHWRIKSTSETTVELTPVNFNGTITNIGTWRPPTRIVQARTARLGTIRVEFNQGWAVDIRVHNSKRTIGSEDLKTTTTLAAYPSYADPFNLSLSEEDKNVLQMLAGQQCLDLPASPEAQRPEED